MASVLGGLLGAPLAGSARAEEEPEVVAPNVSLDRLLRLPSDSTIANREERRVAGATRVQWVERFTQAHRNLAQARASLRSAQAQLEEMASQTDAWQLTAPGAQTSPENSPVSFKLRQDIRRYREDIARYEDALTELRIEANLAGVPRAWQKPELQSDDDQDRIAGKSARPGSAKRDVSAK